MHIYTLHNLMTLTFDLFTSRSGSMHAEVLPYRVHVYQVLVLRAKVVFLSERGHTHTQTHKVRDAADHLTHALAILPE